MVFLYVKVKQEQSQIFIDAKTVAQQAVIYLFVLYLVILPWLVIVSVEASGHGDNIPYVVVIIAEVNFDLFGKYMSKCENSKLKMRQNIVQYIRSISFRTFQPCFTLLLTTSLYYYNYHIL